MILTNQKRGNILNKQLYLLHLQRLTVTKILSRKVCYISEMDLTTSSPAKLKADLNRVKNLILSLKNTSQYYGQESFHAT